MKFELHPVQRRLLDRLVAKKGDSENAPPETYLRKHAAGYPSGTGSAGTLPMSQDEKDAALAKEAARQPFGFTSHDDRPDDRPR